MKRIPESISSPAMYLGTRQVPEIDGSQGAFIAVVVALSVLIVVCCAAVFYLLRHHEPTDQDRAARRERYRRTREQTLRSSSGPSSSLGDKVKQMWQSTTGRGPGRGRGGPGWIRAGSDDEWATRSDRRQGLGGGTRPSTNPDPEVGDRLGSSDPRAASGDGVHVVESPSSDSASGFAVRGYPFANPFSSTASDSGALQRSQSPLSESSSSSPALSSPREGTSLEGNRQAHSPGPRSADYRHRSAMSNNSVWTHAGSKFVEDI